MSGHLGEVEMALLPERIPGERLLIKIWETVFDRGVGGLLSPWQIRREGKARAEVRRLELQALAQARVDELEILTGRKTLDDEGRLIESKPAPDLPAVTATPFPLADPAQLLKGLRHEQDFRLTERAINLRATIAMAEDEAASTPDEDVSEEPVDPDWFARWRVNAEEVRDDQMRRLWARILAGEVQKPGRFSLHTLDFMRRLSKDDAALIERVAPFISGRDLFHGDRLDPILVKKQLNLETLMELQDLGVLSGIEIGGFGGLQKTFTVDPQTAIRYRKKALLVRSHEAKMLRLPLYGVTKVGAEVMSLGKFEADDEYVRAVGQAILYQGFEVSLGEVREMTGDQYAIVNAQRLFATES
jgi:hypothetical protein